MSVSWQLELGNYMKMHTRHKDARIERERRFLLDRFPTGAEVVRTRHIEDHYIEDTTLRLRKQWEDHDWIEFKLTQKIPERAGGAQQGFITSMVLTKGEFGLLARLPAKQLSKTRYSVPPFGIDVFDGELEGLVTAEAEFDSAAAADALIVPSFVRHEVSADDRFTGGRLARASPQEVRMWLLEYGLAV